jgi:hypothetical protein
VTVHFLLYLFDFKPMNTLRTINETGLVDPWCYDIGAYNIGCPVNGGAAVLEGFEKSKAFHVDRGALEDFAVGQKFVNQRDELTVQVERCMLLKQRSHYKQ